MRFAVCLSLVPDPETIDVDPLTGEIDADRTLHIMDLPMRRRWSWRCGCAATAIR